MPPSSKKLPAKKKVQVWIFGHDPNHNEHHVLLLKTLQARGSFWQPVTGSVEGKESLEDAALREATEETGLRFTSPTTPLEHSFKYEKRGARFEEYGFALEVKLPQGKFPAVHMDSNEHEAYQWVPAVIAREKVQFESNKQMLDILLSRLRGR